MLKELDGCCEVVDVGTEGGAKAMLVGCLLFIFIAFPFCFPRCFVDQSLKVIIRLGRIKLVLILTTV